MRETEKILIIDTETANSVEDGLCYDIGFIIADRHGRIYETRSYCIYDIFVLEADLMKTAYYANKLPLYYEGLDNGTYTLATLFKVRREIADLMTAYKVRKVFAYNCFFDKTMLNKTTRYISKSACRFFFPYGTEFHDIWNFACSTICQTKSYKVFCEKNDYISNRGRNYKATAETVYQYLNGTPDFTERHQGLEDVKIEYAILLACYRTHKKVTTDIDRLCWRKVKRV